MKRVFTKLKIKCECEGMSFRFTLSFIPEHDGKSLGSRSTCIRSDQEDDDDDGDDDDDDDLASRKIKLLHWRVQNLTTIAGTVWRRLDYANQLLTLSAYRRRCFELFSYDIRFSRMTTSLFRGFDFRYTRFLFALFYVFFIKDN